MDKKLHLLEGGDSVCPVCHLTANPVGNIPPDENRDTNDQDNLPRVDEAAAETENNDSCPIHQGTGPCLPTCPSIIADESTRPTNLLGMKGLFLDNLAIECSIERLRTIFETYGPMECVEKTVASRSRDDEIRAFAYISFKHARSATAAIAGVRAKQFGSDIMLMSTRGTERPLDIGFTGSKTQRLTPNRIFSTREARKRMAYGQECFEYRLGRRCTMGMFCQFRHIPCNQGIDRFSLVDVNMPLP